MLREGNASWKRNWRGLSENPMRAKRDPNSLVLLFSVPALHPGKGELNISTWGQAPARTTFLFPGCPSLALSETPHPRKHAAF